MLADLARVTGLRTNKPIDLYIYSNTQDMRDAILYEPGWTGGLAYSDHNIVIIGITADQMDWGKRTQAHELTHVLVGQLTFSCLSDIPTWLQEGLAVYGEGGPDDPSQKQFDKAVQDDALLPVRSLSGGFSEDPSERGLKYLQSMVNKQVDGVLLMSSSVSDDWIEELTRRRTPVVALDWHQSQPAEGAVRVISVDFETGIYQAVEHLIHLGHRRFAHVSGPLNLRLH